MISRGAIAPKKIAYDKQLQIPEVEYILCCRSDKICWALKISFFPDIDSKDVVQKLLRMDSKPSSAVQLKKEEAYWGGGRRSRRAKSEEIQTHPTL